jgi:hypothetical protein
MVIHSNQHEDKFAHMITNLQCSTKKSTDGVETAKKGMKIVCRSVLMQLFIARKPFPVRVLSTPNFSIFFNAIVFNIPERKNWIEIMIVCRLYAVL